MPEVGGTGLDKKKIIIIGVVGGAAGLWYLHQRSNAAASAGSATPATGTDSSGLDSAAYGSAGSSGAGGFGGGMTPGANYTGGATTLADGSTYSQPGTNAAWVQDAVNYLSGLGQDSTTVLTALGNYVNGATLTAAQQQIVQQALGAFGSTPTAVPPTKVITTPSPSTRSITVGKGETQKEIINAAGISYAEFLKLNPSLAPKGSQVHAGQKVVI